jgi:hypothetical protein
MTSRQRYKTSFGFIDLLFNLLVGFTFMFILAFMLINPIAKKHELDPKAEYLIIMTWDSKSISDVDIWVMDDLDHVVSFRQKDQAMINLDRDDLGLSNDTYINGQGEAITRSYNREVVSIRTKDQRRYLVTVHYYNARGRGQGPQFGLAPTPEPGPDAGHNRLGRQEPNTNLTPSPSAREEVKIQLLQLNPWTLLHEKTVVLETEGQEIHIFEFKVDADENVTVEETNQMIINAPGSTRQKWSRGGMGTIGP